MLVSEEGLRNASLVLYILKVEQLLHHLVLSKVLVLTLVDGLVMEYLPGLLIEEGGINHDGIAHLHVVGFACFLAQSAQDHLGFALAALLSS